MKKCNPYILTIIALAIFSCSEKVKEKPKVIYVEKEVVKTEVKRDTTNIKISDLPVYMDGSKYLIYPVGDIRVFDTGKFSSYGNSKTNSVSYAISNYSRFEITGDFDNLKFQHIDSTKIRPLTDKILKIQTATFLDPLFKRTNKAILVYAITDADTNGDGRIDSNDIKSLYISNIDGTKFTKLSDPYHELIDWNVVDPIHRLYFRSIQDINKNGAFDKEDKLHYNYVNLLDGDWKVKKLDPVNNLSAKEYEDLNKQSQTENSN